MRIERTKECWSDNRNGLGVVYATTYYVYDEKEELKAFYFDEALFIAQTRWLDLSDFGDKTFLDKNGIEYLTEEDQYGGENYIPIGLVELCDSSKAKFYELNILQRKKDITYKSNQLLENIERAIAIKAEGYKFIKSFGNVYCDKVDDVIEL